MELNVNGKSLELDDDYASGVLVWALRDGLGLTATKFGCGIGICGSCTVHIDGEAVRSCMTPVNDVVGKEIRTLEGLPTADGALHPVQEAFLEAQVPQCSWCMSGQMMTAAAFLEKTPDPDPDQIVEAMQDNYCRCGCYVRIRTAVADAAHKMQEVS
jgi:isoquinoline 1-oxidoreductase alpha subunit